MTDLKQMVLLMGGFLDFEGMLEFYGGKSRSWGRLHLHEIPHRKRFGVLLFDPKELRRDADLNGERRGPVDVDGIVDRAVRDVLGDRPKRVPPAKRKGDAAGAGER